MKVVLWSSAPCAGGSPWQRKQDYSESPEYRNHLQTLFTVHRKLWRSWLKLNSHPQVKMWVIEWPQRCSYWGWQSTRSFLSTRERRAGIVNGCMAGMVGQDGLLVKKIWKLVSNEQSFVARTQSAFTCDGSHEHSQKFVLKSTQHCPVHFARVALKSLSLPGP